MVLQTIRSFTVLGIVGLLFSGTTSCYYDKEELLYPDTLACDTISVSYAADVETVLNNSCYGCHSNAQSQVAGAGISLESHANLSSYITNNQERFLGAIKHEAGYSPMPKGGAQLSECDINKIEAWINGGSNDN